MTQVFWIKNWTLLKTRCYVINLFFINQCMESAIFFALTKGLLWFKNVPLYSSSLSLLVMSVFQLCCGLVRLRQRQGYGFWAAAEACSAGRPCSSQLPFVPAHSCKNILEQFRNLRNHCIDRSDPNSRVIFRSDIWVFLPQVTPTLHAFDH